MEKNNNAPRAIAKIKVVPTKKIDGIEEKIGKNLFEIFTDVNAEDLKIIVRSLEIVERAAIYSKHGEGLEKCKKISNDRNYNMAIYTLESLISNYNKTLYETLNMSKEELIEKLEYLTDGEKKIIYKVHGIDLYKTIPAEKILDKQSLRTYRRLLNKLSKKTIVKTNEVIKEEKKEEVKLIENIVSEKVEISENVEEKQPIKIDYLNIPLKELYKNLNIVVLKFIVEIQPMYLREIIYKIYGCNLDSILANYEAMNVTEFNTLKEALFKIDKLAKIYVGIEEEYKLSNNDIQDKPKNNNKKKKKKKVNTPQMLEGQLETFRLTFLEKYSNLYGNCLSENEINNIIVESILSFDKDEGLNIVLSSEYKINNRLLKVLSDKYNENLDNEKGMEIMMTIIDIYTSKFKQKYPYLSDNVIEKTIEESFECYDGSKTFNIATEIKLKKLK